MDKDYIIQAGDTFFQLAQRWGGNCSEWLQANPAIDPNGLQVGQKICLPVSVNVKKDQRNQYASAGKDEGKDFSGDHLDEIEIELAGIQFKVRRIGETKIPHEIHVILPRAEIRKIQPGGEDGPCELQVILSNVDIVHSPRLTSEGGVSIATATGQRTDSKQAKSPSSASSLSPISQNTASGMNPTHNSYQMMQNDSNARPDQIRQNLLDEPTPTIYPIVSDSDQQANRNTPMRLWNSLFKRR